MRVGLSTRAIFAIWVTILLQKLQIWTAILYGDMTPLMACRPVIDCKMNDPEWLFHVENRNPFKNPVPKNCTEQNAALFGASF